MRVVRGALYLILPLLFASAAHAQRRCTKGIPCGNTCISATKTCRIRPAPQAPAQPTAAPSTPPLAPVAAPDSMPWVASSRGSTYYRRGCATATKLAPQNLIYFETDSAAEAAGYRRSRSKGC